MENFIPKIITFCCYHSAYESADMAGSLKLSFPESLEIMRMPCSGKIDSVYLLKSFEEGADGVLILACHQDSCKYLRGNTRVKKRVDYVKKILKDIGLEEERLHLEYLSPNQAHRFIEITNNMEEKIRNLGPTPLK